MLHVDSQGGCHLFRNLRGVGAEAPLDTFHLNPGVWLVRDVENPLVRKFEEAH